MNSQANRDAGHGRTAAIALPTPASARLATGPAPAMAAVRPGVDPVAS